MKLDRTRILKGLLAVVPALLLALILQPTSALAHTVTYQCSNPMTGWLTYANDSSYTYLSSPTETVDEGKSPVFAGLDGTVTRPYAVHIDLSGWCFDYWMADKEVTLSDGTTFDASKPITQAQLLKIVVKEDLTLTAYFRTAETYTFHYLINNESKLKSISPSSEDVTEGSSPSGPTVEPMDGEEFGYWTATTDVELTDGTIIAAGTKFSDAQLKKIKATENTYFWAFAKSEAPYTVNYTTDGHGDISDLWGRTETVYWSNSPLIPASMVYPSNDYEFDYWTSDVPVTLTDGTVIPKNTVMTHAQLLKVSVVEDNITFQAHFKQTKADVTYESAGNGSVSRTSETVALNEYELPDGTTTIMVGMISGPELNPAENYKFVYWTVNVNVLKTDFSTITPNDMITTADLSNIYVTQNTTFTAHFKRVDPYTITYTTDENGYIDEGKDTESVEEGSSPTKVPTPHAKDSTKYVFDYWTADKDVAFIDYAGGIAQGNPITSDEIGEVEVTSDITFTAHFYRSPVNVSYKTDGHGYTDGSPEQVSRDEVYRLLDDAGKVRVGAITSATAYVNEDYEFDYWDADKDVYFFEPIAGIVLLIPAHTKLNDVDGCLERYYVLEDTTFTAHFKRTTPYTVTYTSAGNGTVSPTTEEVSEGDSPKGPTTITPDTGYEFSHWTANKDVKVANEDATQAISLTANDNEADPQAATTTITAGQPISAEQFSRILMADDVEFEAHFKEIKVDPEPEPVNPDGGDGSDTIKPADGEGGKLTPKTGDTLPGATAAVALGAGVVVAGAALLKKRVR